MADATNAVPNGASGVTEDDGLLSDVIPSSTDPSRQPSTVPPSRRTSPPPAVGTTSGRGAGRAASSKLKQVSTAGQDDDDEEEEEEEEEEESDSDKEEKESSDGEYLTEKQRQNRRQGVRKQVVEKDKHSDQLRRFGYLLGETEVFRHFCDLKAQRDPAFKNMLEEAEQLAKAKAGGGSGGNDKRRGGKGGGGNNRRRKTEKEEDQELLEDVESDEEDEEEEGGGGGKGKGKAKGKKKGRASGGAGDVQFMFRESPSYIQGGSMRDYQVQGLNWMIGLHHNGINGILADEMGLGKTLQTIGFLGYLKLYKNLRGPHLVVVPKSTLDNWQREFAKWVPDFEVTLLSGNKDERAEIIKTSILPQSFEILITSYEMCLREKSCLKRIGWEYIVIDEAHRIKNVDSMLSQIVRIFQSRSRLLITGTPLQNNMKELWALLNFLLPDVFSSSEDFDSWFHRKSSEQESSADPDDPEAANSQVIKQLHAVLKPFLLRRVKSDVEKSLLPKKEINIYVGMSEMQRKWYRMILEKDIDAVNGVTGKKEGKTRLLNVVMQLRKCCNHPYLFDGAEPGPPYTTDEHLVQNCGKMIILDKLLRAMKEKGSRVLIFSQMSRVLDILEDYCLFREYKYNRIDGSTNHDDRVAAIDEYNAPESEKFIFLLTTRAGGLGINLTSADIVVLFDSDWNPQADLQAMDRAHRIGQTKQVFVFRFITENAVEEKVLERAAQKLRLDQLVIQQGRAQQNNKAASKDDLVDMIQHGAEKIISSDAESMNVDDDIEAIIRRGESKTQELNSKYAGLDFDALNSFRSENTQQWEGEDFAAKKKKLRMSWIEPSKRERKTNYSIDGYYRDAMRQGEPKKPAGPKAPKAPKQIPIADFQFFPQRLVDLQERETAAYRKAVGYSVPLREDESTTPEELEAERQAAQDEIDNAEPLTEEEIAEKDELAGLGFPTWGRRDFQAFIRGCENYGRDNYDLIATEVKDKTVDEIEEYAEVFWDRYQEIEGWEAQLAKIEAAESRRNKANHQFEVLVDKTRRSRDPLNNLKIPYRGSAAKTKIYSEEEDRFLLVSLAKYGTADEGVFELIRRDACEHPAFLFDWFIKSRTTQELQRRCQTLLDLLVGERAADDDDEEMEDTIPNGKGKGKGKGKKKATAVNGTAVNGKKRKLDEVSMDGSRDSTPGSTQPPKRGPKKKKT